MSEFLISPKEYTSRRGPADDIVLSSRARLARNLSGSPFPAWAKKSERIRILKKARAAVLDVPDMVSCLSEDMDQLTGEEKSMLVERHLISREHAARGGGSGLILNKEENISVMINEEDHLRMQVILPGLQVREAWQKINNLDSELDKRLPFAFSPTYGYLTACPTNLGTGMRVSAMLHLPALSLSDQINQIISAVDKIKFAVRGIYGEGSDPLGNMFQVSNRITLGETEEDIVKRFIMVVWALFEREKDARRTLIETDQNLLLNHIGRSYGILSNCYSIDAKETLNLLSFIRLGCDFGMFEDNNRGIVDELFLTTQPGHLQSLTNEVLEPKRRDKIRADLLRRQIRKLGTPHEVEIPDAEN